MLYKFNKRELKYVKVNLFYLKAIAIVFISCVITSLVFEFNQSKSLNNIKYVTEETKMLIINQENVFNEQLLKEYIMELNIKFPHIVFAQAKLESGYFKSTIFRENNNLFGMKVARARPTTNKGENRSHALFNNWRESVIDYAFYQAKYLGDVKTEAQYIQYLKANYAEDPGYVEKVIKLSK